MRSLAAPVALVAVAAVTPAQLLSSSLKAARAQHSVHYVAAATFGSVGVTTVADAALDRGVQYVTCVAATAPAGAVPFAYGSQPPSAKGLFSRGGNRA